MDRIQRLLKHLTTSPAFALAFLLVLLPTLLLTVFELLPPAAPALLLCYPFGLGLAACLVDAFISWRDRRYPSFLWLLVWVAILVVINSALFAVVVWSWQAA